MSRVRIAASALAVVAFTAMAQSAPAQETGVQVREETTRNVCNPCLAHITGESHLTAMPSGVEVSTCQDEFYTDIYSDGTGEIEWLGDQHRGPGCGVINCINDDEPHWPMTAMGELSDSTEHVTIRICLRSAFTGAELHCDVETSIADTAPFAHDYVLSADAECAGGVRRYEGRWQVEHDLGDDEFELIH